MFRQACTTKVCIAQKAKIADLTLDYKGTFGSSQAKTKTLRYALRSRYKKTKMFNKRFANKQSKKKKNAKKKNL